MKTLSAMPNYHPDSRYLTDYASGNLDLGLSIVVKTHLAYCSDCRKHVSQLEQVGSCLFEQQEKSAVSDNLLDKVFEQLDQPSTAAKTQTKDTHNPELPSVLSQLIAKPLKALDWRKLTKSLQFFKINTGDKKHEVAFYHIKAGGSIPNHKHHCDEVTLVIKGSFSDEDGVYKKGDFLVRSQGETHKPIATQDEDCLCLTGLEKPVAFTGWLRILNPWLKVSPS